MWLFLDVEMSGELSWSFVNFPSPSGRFSVSVAGCSLAHIHIMFSSSSSSCHAPAFPPLSPSSLRSTVPPLGWGSDAGWRHSGLILLLLMLMLKEAIGTCYFCLYLCTSAHGLWLLKTQVIRHGILGRGSSSQVLTWTRKKNYISSSTIRFDFQECFYGLSLWFL